MMGDAKKEGAVAVKEAEAFIPPIGGQSAAGLSKCLLHGDGCNPVIGLICSPTSLSLVTGKRRHI
jgi:hypothetical protein